jgi:hypothetical protein
MLVAFVGVTGFLPLSVVSFIQGIRDIAGKVMSAAITQIDDWLRALEVGPTTPRRCDRKA